MNFLALLMYFFLFHPVAPKRQGIEPQSVTGFIAPQASLKVDGSKPTLADKRIEVAEV